jgi:preprotein translocase subunit SecG
MQYLPTIVILMAIVVIGAILWSRSQGGGLWDFK